MFLTLLSSALWGSTYTLVQIGLNYYSTYQISFLRALLAIIAMLAIVFAFQRKTMAAELFFLPRDKENWALLISASIFGSAGFWTLLNLSVKYLNADTASFVSALYPLIALVLASFLLKEKMTFGRALGVTIGIIGAYLILSYGKTSSRSSEPVLGTIFALMTALAFAGYIIVCRILIGRKDKKSGHTFSPAYVTLATFTIAVPPTLILAGLSAPLSTLFNSSPTAIGAILFLGIFCSAVAFLVFNLGLKMVGAARASINQLLFPVVSIILSYFLLGETINASDALGIFMILGGILVAQRIGSPIKV